MMIHELVVQLPCRDPTTNPVEKIGLFLLSLNEGIPLGGLQKHVSGGMPVL